MRIYLTEGFAGEPVRVTVNGTQVLDLSEARTNWSAGVAASATAAVTGSAQVVVEVPGRGTRAEHTMDAREDRALLVRIDDAGRLVLKEEDEPVRFM